MLLNCRLSSWKTGAIIGNLIPNFVDCCSTYLLLLPNFFLIRNKQNIIEGTKIIKEGDKE